MENIEKDLFTKASDSVLLTKTVFAYSAKDNSKQIHRVLITEAWNRTGIWNGNFNFYVTTGSYSTIYTDLGLEYFGEIYKQLKSDNTDETVLNTLEDIVRSYIPDNLVEESEEEIEEVDSIEKVKKHE